MTTPQDDFQLVMNQGHSAAWDQSWDRAAEFYRLALKIIPDNPQALSSLGLALVEIQNFDEALVCYQATAKAQPDDPIPLEKIAQLSERLGNLDQATQASLRAAELYLKNRDVHMALQCWSRVIRLDPENLLARTRLALVYERVGEKQKAVAEYLAAASLFQVAGDLVKTRQAVEQALRILPNNEQAIQALNLLKDFKQLPRPDRTFDKSVESPASKDRKLKAPEAEAQSELNPVDQASQKAITVLAGILFEGMDEDRDGLVGRRGLQAIVTGTGMLHKPLDRTRMMLHLSQMVDLQSREEYARASEELQRSIDVGLDHPAAFYNLGYLYLKTGRLESAVRQLQHSIKHVDFALATRLLLGEILRQKGQVGEASVEFLQALQLADIQMVPPEQANDLLQLYELLIESYRQRSDPESQTRICDNIQGMLMRDDWRTALRQARKQLPARDQKIPPIPLAEILMESSSSKVIESISSINQMIDKGYYHSAMEEAFYALEYTPTYLPLHSVMGQILLKEGDLPAAVEKYESVARVYGVRGDTKQAIDIFRKVVDLTPTDLEARKRLIDQLVAFGEIEKAIDEYEQLADVYTSFADLNMARKAYMDCLQMAQQANLSPDLLVKILRYMVDIDLQSMDWRQAIRILDQICHLQPYDEEARYNLVQINFRLEQEPQALTELDKYLEYLRSKKWEKKGLAILERLVNEFPNNVPVKRRLVDLYRHLGRNEEAVTQLDAIGKILLGAGDRASAIQTLEMILSINPLDKAEYQKILNQIRQG